MIDALFGNRRTGAALLLLLTAAVYANSLGGAFVGDDVLCITENPSIRHLWPPAQALSPPHNGGLTVEGRPLINLSLAVNYAIGGLHVRSYHIANIVIHAAVGLLLWALLRMTLRRPLVPQAVHARADAMSWLIAALWLVHPLATAAVTYVIQRAESIMACCYLAMLCGLVRGADSTRPAPWYAAAVAASAAGMASKETMVTAPVIALLYDRTFLAGSFRRALRRRWALYLALAATWLILFGLRGGRGTSAGLEGVVSPGQYAITQFMFLARYLRLVFWPHPLAFDYGRLLVGGLGEVWPQALVVSFLAAGTAVALWKKPWLGFMGAWFFIILAPSSSFIPVHTQTGAEHRMYLPLAAVVSGAVFAAWWLGRRAIAPRLGWPATRAAGIGLAALALAGLAAGTVLRNRDYRTPESLWQSLLAIYPDHPRAHFNLAGLRREAGDMAGAREHYFRTVRAQPDFPFAYLNLGCADATLGRHAEAIADFDHAAAYAPGDLRIYMNRALSHWMLKHYEAAIADFDRVIAAAPGSADAYYMRGLAQRELGRGPDAIRSFTLALQYNPQMAPACIERAITNHRIGDDAAARADVERYRALGGTPDPQFIEALSRTSASGHLKESVARR